MLFSCTCIRTFPAPASQMEHYVTQAVHNTERQNGSEFFSSASQLTNVNGTFLHSDIFEIRTKVISAVPWILYPGRLQKVIRGCLGNCGSSTGPFQPSLLVVVMYTDSVNQLSWTRNATFERVEIMQKAKNNLLGGIKKTNICPISHVQATIMYYPIAEHILLNIGKIMA